MISVVFYDNTLVNKPELFEFISQPDAPLPLRIAWWVLVSMGTILVPYLIYESSQGIISRVQLP